MDQIKLTPYKDALTSIMIELGNEDNTIFIGQQIIYPGNPMSTTLTHVDADKMVEVPVMEESQLGMSLGLAMTGLKVITFYPRWDFILLATNQLVNHVDKFKLMTGQTIHLIIRLGKGSDKPLDPGHQHKGNYFKEFSSMCPNCRFYDLTTVEKIKQSYAIAKNEPGIHILVEYPELYYV